MSLLVEGRLGYTFRSPWLLELALTHPSWANEHGGPSYQRLEFLGDAVLQLAVSVALFERFPDADEGELSRYRTQLVNTDTLARVAVELGLDQQVRLGAGEAGSRTRSPKVLADVVEAVLGAVFLDGGDAPARSLAEGWLEERLAQLERVPADNPKGTLQERLQALGLARPTYTLRRREGPDHAPRFWVEVHAGPFRVGGQGASRREAEQEAARAALRRLDLDGVRALPEVHLEP